MAVKEGRERKSIFKRWWFWLIVIIIIIIIASNCGGNKSATPNNTNTNTSNKTTTQAPKKAAPKPTTKTYKIGDTVNVGKMVYKVNSKSTASQVGPSALPTKASGKYIVIDVTVQNKGDKAVTIDSSFFKLMQGKKSFDADSAASMSANQSESGNIQNSFFMQDLNPESKATGKIVFDVAPSIASSSNLQLQVQEGIFGTNTAMIDLK